MQNIYNLLSCPLCASEKFSIIKSSLNNLPIEHSDINKIFSSSSDFELTEQLVSCTNCTLIYVNPQIQENIILNAYSDDIDEKFISQNKSRIITFTRYINWFCNFLKMKPNKNIKLLDIGCAGGAFLFAAQEMGFSVIGVEPNKWLAKKGEEMYDVKIIPSSLEEAKLDNNKFDIISLWDVIEHLPNPSKVLTNISKVLSYNGYLIINFPNYDSLARKIMGFKWPFFLNVHLIYFNKKTMQKLLIDNGFQLIKIKPFYQTLELDYILTRASNTFKFFKYVNIIIRKLGLSKLKINYNLGQSLVIAKKI